MGNCRVELKVNIEVKVDGSTLHQAKVKPGRKRAQTKFRKQPFIGSCHIVKRTYTKNISGNMPIFFSPPAPLPAPPPHPDSPPHPASFPPPPPDSPVQLPRNTAPKPLHCTTPPPLPHSNEDTNKEYKPKCKHKYKHKYERSKSQGIVNENNFFYGCCQSNSDEKRCFIFGAQGNLLSPACSH